MTLQVVICQFFIFQRTEVQFRHGRHSLSEIFDGVEVLGRSLISLFHQQDYKLPAARS